MTSSYSKTCTCVCPHENAKRAFSKNSTLGTMLKNLRFYAWNRHTGVGGRLSKEKKRLVWCMASSYSKTCVCVCPRENAKRAFPKNSTLGTLFKNLRFYAWKHRTGVRLIKGKKRLQKYPNTCGRSLLKIYRVLTSFSTVGVISSQSNE